MRFSWGCRGRLKCSWRVGCCSFEEIAPGTHWVLLWQEDQLSAGSPEYQAGSLGGHKWPEPQCSAGGGQRPKEFSCGICGIISTMFYFPDSCILHGTRECHFVLTEGKAYGKPYKDSFFKKLFLLIFGYAGSSLLSGLFSAFSEWRPLSSCGVWASHCGAFSSCELGSRVCKLQ